MRFGRAAAAAAGRRPRSSPPPPAAAPSPSLSRAPRSASLDSTVKVWDPATGKERFTLSRHSAMVYAMGFSPDGEYLATGSTDRSVYVWRARDGALVRAFAAPSGVYDLSFNATGDKVAVCCANAAVAVVELRL